MAGSARVRASSFERSSICRSLSNSIVDHASPAGTGHGRLVPAHDGPNEAAGWPRRKLGVGESLGDKKMRRPEPVPGPAGAKETLARGRRLALVLALEPLHPPRRVHELLLAREKGMALRAHLDPDVGPSRTGLDDLPARTSDGRVHVARMNTHLHEKPPRDTREYQPPQQNAKPLPLLRSRFWNRRVSRIGRDPPTPA